ncbi:BMP-2-inducible protein kinase-like [Episyrphus balteatus]|uniref:BMP-2-inducible protein kinase-like n=1 Tax=Episyrphus balteatus TaxID=286459 RepID=UPI0024860B5B|nr:BMP-2-inducible protein kinase-like [Episyrphus balteatus]XP_055850221.1 BMP-2-inducible protein kinase-like [Episyrphus balteatus]
MKIIWITTFCTILLQCNGDISQSINQHLPLNAFSRIPTPTQSLLPPTFENPIKDYTVGLVPPPIEGGQSTTDDRRPKVQHIHSSPHTRTNDFINTARPFRNSAQQQQQQRSGYTTAVHHQIHHPSNVLHQPQVYQPKTPIYQPAQQFTAHHHPHHHHIPTTYNAGIVRQPVATVAQHQYQHHHHNHPQYTPQYYEPVTQNRVHHQHSTHTQYASIPVQRAPTVVQHVHPSVQKSAPAFVPRPVPSSGSSIIQTYPSVSYVVTPQHGSTLNFGNAKLDPELVHIISEVVGGGQNH